MKTFIRRPGNKSKHLKYLIPLIPPFEGTYIEPFVGTGAVFLKLSPVRWLLNDINQDLMGLWEIVRDDPEYLLSEIRDLKHALLVLDTKAKIALCKTITESIEGESDERRKCVKCHLMTYCSFVSTLSHSYSSKKYFFTGLYKPLFAKNHCHVFTETYAENIRRVRDNLRKGTLMNRDYREALQRAQKGDFVFLDPPYFGDKDYTFSYNEGEDLDGGFVKSLQSELATLDRNSVKWMMTQVDCAFIRECFKGYTIVEIKTNNGVCDKKRSCELVILNYDPPRDPSI